MNLRIRPFPFAAMTLAAVLLARPACAGPPLLCFPFDIGSASSLPMGHGNWHATDPSYDVSRLGLDTLALLTQRRRASSAWRRFAARQFRGGAPRSGGCALFDELAHERQRRHPQRPRSSPYDFGYLVESFKEAKFLFKEPLPAIDRIDGYQLVLKAHALQRDAAMQQAARLIVEGYPRAIK